MKLGENDCPARWIRLAADAYRKSWLAVLLVLGTTASFAADADPIKPGAWSLAVLPDTQHYIRDRSPYFADQTQWIKNHLESHNIQYVLHLGDIVENNVPPQWDMAKTAMSTLDGVVPYAIAPGNHDYGDKGKSDTRHTFFCEPQYFGPGSPYAKQSTIGGFFKAEKTDNSYHTFRAGDRDWLILALEFGPRDEVVAWANSMVEAHPRHHVILITHAYLLHNDKRHDWSKQQATSNPHHYGLAKLPGGANDGQELWDKLVSKHDNFRMVLNGHILGDGAGYLKSTTDGGAEVHQMLSNYQSPIQPNGGNGYMRYLEFLDHGDNIDVTVRSYSPTLGNHLRTPNQEFTFTIAPVKPGPDGANK